MKASFTFCSTNLLTKFFRLNGYSLIARNEVLLAISTSTSSPEGTSSGKYLSGGRVVK